MTEGGGSTNTPPRPSRTRTTTGASNASTPSRISRLFSFGASTSTTATSNAVATGNDTQDIDDVHVGVLLTDDSSSINSSEVDTLPGDHQGGRPSTPTPLSTRRGSRTAMTPNAGPSTAVDNSLSTPQRRGSIMTSLLGGAGAGAAPASTSTATGIQGSQDTPPRPSLSNTQGSSSTSSWRLPWSSGKKRPALPAALSRTESHPSNNEHQLHTAQSYGSLQLTMNGEAEEPETAGLPPADVNGSPKGEVLDEGISMSDTSGKVDFLTSLPLELSLYVLLFADVQTICRATQVSPTWHTIASDALIWRDHFYRNPGWELRPEVFEAAKAGNLAASRNPAHTLETPSKMRTPTATRSRRSTTGTNDGSIAARIGKRIGDIVSEISFMTLRQERTAAHDASNDASAPATSATIPVELESEPEASTSANILPDNAATPSAATTATPSRGGTPSRSRSNTATSQAATHPSNFYTPLRSSMRQSQQQAGTNVGPTPPSRRASQSFSIVQSLLESGGHAHSMHGLPAGPQVFGSNSGSDHPTVHYSNDTAHGTADMPPPPEARTRSQSAAMISRRLSGPPFSPYQSLASPNARGGNYNDEFNNEVVQSAFLFLDWKGLYRDRYELEKRWDEGNFTNRVLKSHTDSVYCVALMDETLISGSRDQTIKVWNVNQTTPLRTIEAHTASVLAIQYDGKIMVTGASNGELFVWDVKTWEVTDILEGHTAGVLDVQMNDKWIASCSKDTSIRVWKRDTKEEYRVLHGHRGPVNAIQLWNDTICSASGDSLAKLWDIESGQCVRVFKGHERGLACVQYTGDALMTGSNDKTIRVWDPRTGACLKVLKGHRDLVRTLSYDPIRKRLFSGSYDKTTRLWDVETGNLKMTFKPRHKSLVFDVTMDVSRLVSCSHDQRIVVVDFGEELGAHRFV